LKNHAKLSILRAVQESQVTMPPTVQSPISEWEKAPVEQTFYLDLDGMGHPEKSPLRILEKQLGKNLMN
jgi:hypothetical protein